MRIGREIGTLAPLPVVVTMTEKAEELPPPSCTDGGALHAAAVGAPAQAKLTTPANPVPGVTCKLNCAV